VDGNSIAESYADILGTNSRHVVTMDGNPTDINSDTVLDGFTITAGEAAAGTTGEVEHHSGGGLYCDGRNAGSTCSPTLQNLVFSGNMAYVIIVTPFGMAGPCTTTAPTGAPAARR